MRGSSNASRSREYTLPPSRATGRNLLGSSLPPSSPRTDVLTCTPLISPNTIVPEISVELDGVIFWKLYNCRGVGTTWTSRYVRRFYLALHADCTLLCIWGFTVVCKAPGKSSSQKTWHGYKHTLGVIVKPLTIHSSTCFAVYRELVLSIPQVFWDSPGSIHRVHGRY
jgi:hypothetical protein